MRESNARHHDGLDDCGNEGILVRKRDQSACQFECKPQRGTVDTARLFAHGASDENWFCVLKVYTDEAARQTHADVTQPIFPVADVNC